MENKKVLNQINENGEVILTDEQVDEIVNVLEKERKSILEVPTEEEEKPATEPTTEEG